MISNIERVLDLGKTFLIKIVAEYFTVNPVIRSTRQDEQVRHYENFFE